MSGEKFKIQKRDPNGIWLNHLYDLTQAGAESTVEMLKKSYRGTGVKFRVKAMNEWDATKAERDRLNSHQL